MVRNCFAFRLRLVLIFANLGRAMDSTGGKNQAS